MNVLALVSGGKDSIFNMALCVSMGHRIICLGNLYSGQELDSFMYQTVGGDVVPKIAKCLQLELIRKTLHNDRDSLDTLRELLEECKLKYPEINAISVGAIRSNYQRVRIESVAIPLGLVPLCYMWNQPQELLLSKMLSFQMEIQLVKVACHGLSRKHLKAIDQLMFEYFLKLNKDFGMNVCGEGGEYESLVLWCPLYRGGRLQVDQPKIVEDGDVFYLQYPVDEIEPGFNYEPLDLACLDKSSPVHTLKGEFIHNLPDMPQFIRVPDETQGKLESAEEELTVKHIGNWTSVEGASELSHIPIDQEVVMVNMQIRDLHNTFQDVNQIYKKHFEKQEFRDGQEPACRACVGNNSVDLSLDALIYTKSANPLSKYYKMHVQSRSFWAPSNIGPYSQFISVPSSLQQRYFEFGRVFVAGQIGLIPETMNLADGLLQQCTYAWRHVGRILYTGMHDGDVLVEVPEPKLASCLTYATTLADLKYAMKNAAVSVGIVVDQLPIGALVEYVVESMPRDLMEFEHDQYRPHQKFTQSDHGCYWNGQPYTECFYGDTEQVDFKPRKHALQVTLFHSAPVIGVDQVKQVRCRYLLDNKGRQVTWALLIKYAGCSIKPQFESVVVLKDYDEEFHSKLKQVVGDLPIEFVPVLQYNVDCYRDNLKQFFGQWKSSDYLIISSQRAVESLKHLSLTIGIKCFVVGQKTASMLKHMEIIHVADSAQDLAAHIKTQDVQGKLYFLCGNNRRDTLSKIAQEVICYTSTPIVQEYKPRSCSVVVAMSPLGVESQFEAISRAIESPHFVAIGQTTKQALINLGVDDVQVALSPAVDSLVEAVRDML